MLDLHRTDARILKAIASCRHGATVQEIRDEINRTGLDPISVDTVRRHMPGLVANCGVCRRAAFRGDRPVSIFAKSGECVSAAETANG